MALQKLNKALLQKEENKAKVAHDELLEREDVKQLLITNEELHREVLELAEEGKFVQAVR